MRRALSLLLTLVFVAGVISKTSTIVVASGSVAIRIAPDGSVDPVTAPIEKSGDVYVLTGNVSGVDYGVLVERSGIVFDGSGYVIQGTGVGVGIRLVSVENVAVKSVKVADFGVGVQFENSSMCNMSGNSVEHCGKGVYVLSSFDIWIVGNSVKSNFDGFFISESSGNTIIRNNFTGNDLAGLYVIRSSHNLLCENYFSDNYNGIFLTESSSNNSIQDNRIESNLWSGIGLGMASCQNSIFGNVIERNKWHGIRLEDSFNNTLKENQIVENVKQGILLENSTSNSVCCNSISYSGSGIFLSESTDNFLRGNTLHDNKIGLSVLESSANEVFHNNFVLNEKQVYDYSWDYHPDVALSLNVWDNDYPSGGNYWSDYAGVDLRSGVNQNESGSDALSDSPFEIDVNNVDRYPLMGKCADLVLEDKSHLQIVSNAALSKPIFDGTSFRLIILEESNSTGFCRLTIPTSLMNGSYKVLVNEIEATVFILHDVNGSSNYLYFTFLRHGQEIRVIYEFDPVVMICLILVIGTLAASLFRRVIGKRELQR